MAIKLVSREWNPFVEGYKYEYICDSDNDFDDLPDSICGSFAISISTGAVRTVNTNGEWVAFAEG